MHRLFAGVLLFVNVAVSASEPGRPVTTPEPDGPNDRSICVECCGRLRHGLVSIGGETTGTTITIDRMVWELSLQNESARKFAAEHQKEFVRVTGSLRLVRGTEVLARWVVDVEQIAVTEPDEKAGFAKMSMIGVIHPAADASDTDVEHLTIVADGISFPLDLSSDPSLKTRARLLIREKAALKGLVQRQPGRELPPKTIIRVTVLDKAK